MFDWDEANLAHIARHGITREEAEQAVRIAPLDVMRQYYEEEERSPGGFWETQDAEANCL
jgi:hypothetical protein